jgi:hypothetical protein
MATVTETRKPVNPDVDTRAILYHGIHINGAELARVRSAQNRVYYSRVGSPYSEALDAAMDAAGRDELDRILAEHDAELDRQADESAMLDRYERGFIAL